MKKRGFYEEGKSIDQLLPCPRVSVEELEVFTFPPPMFSQHELWFGRQEAGKEHSVALVVGRFQPLHFGHVYLLKQALTVAETIIIGIGSANIKNEDNPFTIEERESLVYRVIKRERIGERVVGVSPLDDYLNDNVWLKETLRRTGNVDVVVGNNEWVNGIFQQNGYPAIRVPLLDRATFEGRKIRAHLRNIGKL